VLNTRINVLDFDDRLKATARRTTRLERMTKHKDEEYDRCYSFFEDLARDMGVSVPVYKDTDDVESLWGLTQQASQYRQTD